MYMNMLQPSQYIYIYIQYNNYNLVKYLISCFIFMYISKYICKSKKSRLL